MEIDQLRNQAAKLFNYIILLVSINILSFLGTFIYAASLQEKIDKSGIEQSDPTAFTEQVGQIKIIALSGFSVAILAIILCIPLVLKRSKLTKKIHELDLEALGELDIK